MDQFLNEKSHEESWSTFNKRCTYPISEELDHELELVFGASYNMGSESPRPPQSRDAITNIRNDTLNDQPMTACETTEHANVQLHSASSSLLSHNPLAKLLQPEASPSQHPSPIHGQSLVSNTNTWNFPGASRAELLNLFQSHGVRTVTAGEPSRQIDRGTHLPYHQGDEDKNTRTSSVSGKSKRLRLSNIDGITKPYVAVKRHYIPMVMFLDVPYVNITQGAIGRLAIPALAR